MEHKIVWDIDGVCRDLSGQVAEEFCLPVPKTWYFWEKMGHNIYDLVKKDRNILVRAKPTEYFNTINSFISQFKEVEFWTHQPDDWVEYTLKWLRMRVNVSNIKIVCLTPQQKYEGLLYFKENLLVDDFPFFPTYDQIVLINQPYNKECNSKIRIFNNEQLKLLLDNYKNGTKKCI